eukprot:m.34850 g.34850  ORF g.34850 m.34850 type:complete len:145 (+) comp8789_c1_seq1:234-668(+)
MLLQKCENVKQLRQDNFSPGKGNALQVCFAAMFGMDIASVPNFIEDDNGYESGIRAFLESEVNEHKYTMKKVSPPVFDTDKSENLPKLCILRGKSPRGNHAHVVVAESLGGDQFKFVMDPHPDNTFLDTAEPFGWAMVFEVQDL